VRCGTVSSSKDLAYKSFKFTTSNSWSTPVLNQYFLISDITEKHLI
ncbi:hypothetical protein BN863_15700, partial [Formosa agariphila KMM 3901]